VLRSDDPAQLSKDLFTAMSSIIVLLLIPHARQFAQVLRISSVSLWTLYKLPRDDNLGPWSTVVLPKASLGGHPSQQETRSRRRKVNI